MDKSTKSNWNIAYDLGELSSIAGQLLVEFPEARIFTFKGEMGAGKTTLIEEICRSLGSKDNLSSPTYSIINEYHANDQIIYHSDLFRLKSLEEAVHAGIEEAIYSGAYCFIEWAELIYDILPADTIHLEIEVLEPTKRRIRQINLEL